MRASTSSETNVGSNGQSEMMAWQWCRRGGGGGGGVDVGVFCVGVVVDRWWLSVSA